jgi:hypothetical protein
MEGLPSESSDFGESISGLIMACDVGISRGKARIQSKLDELEGYEENSHLHYIQSVILTMIDLSSGILVRMHSVAS